MLNLSNVYYNVDMEDILSRNDLYNYYIEFKEESPDDADLTFGEYLNDCLGKNGSLIKISEHISDLVNDLMRYNFSLDNAINILYELLDIRDKVCDDIGDQIEFDDYLDDLFKRI